MRIHLDSMVSTESWPHVTPQVNSKGMFEESY